MSGYWLLFANKKKASVVAIPLKGGELLVGRGKNCDIVVPTGKVSRRHLIIKRDKGKVSFRDCGSKQGTLLNGVKMDEGLLQVGDTLSIHTTTIKLVDQVKKLDGDETIDVTVIEQTYDGKIWLPFTAFLSKLRSTNSPQILLKTLLDGLLKLFSADRGFVLLEERRSGNLVPVASQSLDELDEFLSISRTVYEKALKGKEVIVINDSSKSPICRSAQSLYDSAPRAIICCPLLSSQKRLGVIYLDLFAIGSEISDEKLNILKSVAAFVSSTIAERRTRKNLLELRQQLKAVSNLTFGAQEMILGEGEASIEMKRLLESAASKDVSVLITGETGTGKELVARFLHKTSCRSDGPFIPVNCAALPKDIVEAELFGVEEGAYTDAKEKRLGTFELANGGTLFLDEIGELSKAVQLSLLRVLEERRLTRLGGDEAIPLDIRLVCATNRDLELEVKKGSFRKDLYYRINVFNIPLPPLRERKEDITCLAQHFLVEARERFDKTISSISPTAMKSLLNYSWPGNIRELRNTVERAVLVEKGRKITPASLSIAPQGKASDLAEESMWQVLPNDYEEAKMLFERTFLKRCLKEAAGNISKAAKNAGMTRCSIYRRLEKLGLLPEKGDS